MHPDRFSKLSVWNFYLEYDRAMRIAEFVVHHAKLFLTRIAISLKVGTA
jgi:hypothetical protein